MAERLTLQDLTPQQLRIQAGNPAAPEWLAAGVLTRRTAARLRLLYLDVQTLLTVFTPCEILSYSRIESPDGVGLVEMFDFAGLTKEFSRRSELGTFLLFYTWPTRKNFATLEVRRRYTLCKWQTAYHNTYEGYLYAPFWTRPSTWALWMLLSLQAVTLSSTWQEYKARICEISDGLESGDG